MTTGGVWDPSAGTPGPHTQHCPSPIAPLPPGEPRITSRYLIRDTSRAPPVLEESSWRSGVCWGDPGLCGASCPGGCQGCEAGPKPAWGGVGKSPLAVGAPPAFRPLSAPAPLPTCGPRASPPCFCPIWSQQPDPKPSHPCTLTSEASPKVPVSVPWMPPQVPSGVLHSAAVPQPPGRPLSPLPPKGPGSPPLAAHPASCGHIGYLPRGFPN